MVIGTPRRTWQLIGPALRYRLRIVNTSAEMRTQLGVAIGLWQSTSPNVLPL
jgi:hypothetical protein